MQEILYPQNETEWLKMRTQDVTSTDVAALFHISPYMTEFELWHRHRNADVVLTDQTERMLWGDRLQDAIAAGIASDMDWKIRRMSEYIRNTDSKMGASFDFEIDSRGDGPCGILEIKNVDSLAFRDGWIDDESGLEAPPHLELQIQHQLAVSERPFAYLGALIGGNRLELVRRKPDPTIIAQIKERVAFHWASVEKGVPPIPDFSRDAEFIAKLYGHAEEGKVFDAKTDGRIFGLITGYQNCLADIKAADTEKAKIKAEILSIVGDSEKVIGDGFTIHMGTVAPGRVEAFERKGYRSFRLNMKKG